MENFTNNFEAENGILVNIIINQFVLDIHSIHGIKHWRRVAEIGNYLAKHTGADVGVINLFAYLHDSKRENEYEDLLHGKRASIFIEELHKKSPFRISRDQLDKLLFACEHHTNSDVKSEDITIQTCWDADRLDLYRVGIVPRKEFLNTDFAKQENTINLFSDLSKF